MKIPGRSMATWGTLLTKEEMESLARYASDKGHGYDVPAFVVLNKLAAEAMLFPNMDGELHVGWKTNLGVITLRGSDPIPVYNRYMWNATKRWGGGDPSAFIAAAFLERFNEDVGG